MNFDEYEKYCGLKGHKIPESEPKKTKPNKEEKPLKKSVLRELVEEAIIKLLPYIENPVIISPKGCFPKSPIEVKPGKVIEYDACLIPDAPKVIDQTENLKALIELYKEVK